MGNSYILSQWNDPLIQFVLNYINDHTYINIRGLNKYYCSEILFDMEKRRSIAIRLGKIFGELVKLEIIFKWSYRTYKNDFKDILFESLEKRMNEKYLLIGIKKIKGET